MRLQPFTRFLRVLLLTLLLAPLAHADDRVILKSGEVVEGDIQLDTPGRIVIRTAKGVRTIRREDVKKVEKEKTPKELYKEKAKALKRGDAAGHYELGLWCREKGLRREAKREFEAVIRLEPDHPEARAELGFVRKDDRWVRGDEAGEKAEPKEAPKAGKKKAPKNDKATAEGEPEPEGPPPGPERNRAEWEADWKRKQEEYKGVPWIRAWEIEGNGYILKCNSTKEVAEWYARALDKIDEELARFFRKAKLIRFVNERTIVHIYKTQSEFRQRTNMGDGIGGFFLPMNGDIHAYHGVFGWSGNTISVLGHEYTHKWTAKVVPDHGKMPPWIREGLAVYFADGIVVPREGEAKVRQIPRDRLLIIQRAIKENRYIKIKDLIRVPQGPQFTGFHYAHAWAVIYWMVNTSKKNRDLFNHIFSDCIQKKFDPVNFEGYCRKIGGIQGFEQKWKEWVLDIEVPPAGQTTETAFTSDFSNFTVNLPDETWEFDEGARAAPQGDLYWLQSAMNKGKAKIMALSGNNDGAVTAAEAVKRKLDSLEKTNKILLKGKVDANGYEAHEIYYTSEPPEPKEEEGEEGGRPGEGEKPEEGGKPEEEKPKPEDPPKEEEGKPDEKAPKKPVIKMRRVYIATVPHLIILQAEAPEEEFDAVDSDFEKVLQTIQIRFE